MSGSGVLYIMDSDGSDVRVVAPGFHTIRSAFVWSPDGRRLAFAARGNLLFVKDELYTVRADGTGLTKLGNTAGTPSWSPDGGRIAFARIDGNTHVAIVTTDPDGSNEQTVFESSEVRTAGVLEPVVNVSWSPDGTRIAITDLVIPWENRPYFGGEGNAVSIVRADGSGRPRLIDAIWLKPRGVSWSPDSSRIAVYIPGNHSPGAALKTMATVELPEQDEFWYRWEDGERGRDATPKSTPTLAQTPPYTSTPTPVPTTTSSLIPEPGFQTTPACQTATSSAQDFRAYEAMVHEAGHAFGLSDFDELRPRRVLNNAVAHPDITDSVMSYDHVARELYPEGSPEWNRADSEPDCAPYPLDIMAIRALYQALNR